MILPIVAYGDPVLKKKAVDIDKDYPQLKEFIANMWETMYAASGVGLAAPQVGKSIRLFVIDGSPFNEEDEHPELQDFKRVFINAEILNETGTEWGFEEGCLSIPKIREEVMRKPKLKMRYLDEKFKEHEEEFDGMAARIIQHEYDHIDGKLFVEKIKPLRKQMIKGKLADISKGKVDVAYKMKFPGKVK